MYVMLSSLGRVDELILAILTHNTNRDVALSCPPKHRLIDTIQEIKANLPRLVPIKDSMKVGSLPGLPADFVTDVTVTVYLAVIALTLILQGLNARYYFVRLELLDDYLRETPDWIVDLQKLGGNASR